MPTFQLQSNCDQTMTTVETSSYIAISSLSYAASLTSYQFPL